MRPRTATLAVVITAPAPLSTHAATVDLGNGNLAAPVRLAAESQAPAGETVTVAWSSDVDGLLGEGTSLEVELSNAGGDVTAHRITATATSSGGGESTATIEIVIQVPSN